MCLRQRALILKVLQRRDPAIIPGMALAPQTKHLLPHRPTTAQGPV